MWTCKRCGRKFETENKQHFCVNPSDIDDYIAMQDEDKKVILQKVREVIRCAAPEAIEKISWQMPTFWQGENLVHFAASKHHLGFYPGGEASGVFSQKLTDAGIRFDKGSIRFPWSKEIDYDLIAEITRWRVEQVKKKMVKEKN